MAIGIGTALSIGSSLLGAYGARRTAQAGTAAIDRQIAAEERARRDATEAAKFRAVGFTSPYGTFRTETDEAGRLTDVGFDLTPEMEARAGRYGALGSEVLANLTADPMEAALRRSEAITALRDPQRAKQREQLFSQQAAKGLLGLGVDVGTGQYAQPSFAGLESIFAQEDLATAIQSEDLARKRILEDLGLTEQFFGAEAGVYDIGRAEMEYGLSLAEQERIARLKAAGRDAESLRNIAQLSGRAGISRAEGREALYSSLGQLGTQMYSSGLFGGSGGGGGGNGAFARSLQNPDLYYS
jgi:hypothetical protein